MLPAKLNNNQEPDIHRHKSFHESLCEGYHFEVKNDIKRMGSRSIYYYKEGHSLLISHFFCSRVHVLNLETGKLRWFDHHGSTVRSTGVCNHEIITTSWDGTVGVTGFDTLERRLILTEKGMGRSPDAAISPDNKSVFSYSYDSDKNPDLTSNAIREWNLSDGRLKRTIQLPGTHLSKRRCGYCMVYDDHLFVVSNTGHLHIYNWLTGSLFAEYFCYDQLQSLCLFPALNMLAMAGSLGTIYLCDFSGRLILSRRKAHLHDISQMFVLPDQPEIMISISFDGTMKMWKIPGLELLDSAKVNGDRLWTATAANDLLIAGGDETLTCIYDIKNMHFKLKGMLIFSDESYAIITNSTHSFFTNDQSIMQVRKDIDGTLPDDQLSEYLLHTECNLSVLKDLFNPENNDQPTFLSNNKGFYQITQ
jgi:hypothetical protein